MKFADKINALPRICPVCKKELSNDLLITSDGNVRSFVRIKNVANPDWLQFKRTISFDEYKNDLFIKDGILTINIPKVSIVQYFRNCFGHYHLVVFKHYPTVSENTPTVIDLNGLFLSSLENIYIHGYKIENINTFGRTNVYEGMSRALPIISISLRPMENWHIEDKEYFLDKINSYLILE